MKQILQKIEWKTRRWSFEVNLFNICLPAANHIWGFELIKIKYHNNYFSLLSLQWRFPNGAERVQVQFFWDLFFMYHYLTDRAIERDEAKLWSRKK